MLSRAPTGLIRCVVSRAPTILLRQRVGFARQCVAMSSSPASASATAEKSAAKIGRWNARLAHDNTFLSYHRNAIIATVAGRALIQYRKGEDRPPLAGAGMLAMPVASTCTLARH